VSRGGVVTISADGATELELETWTMRALADYVGGLSSPSKMPGWAYSLPAKECRTGSKLRVVTDSVCHDCYAMKGRYVFPKVQAALYRRLDAISKPMWAEAIAELIRRKGETYFRWHDSGDLQSVQHLGNICRVCELTPEVSHWLPTREYRTVSDYLTGGGEIPPNLNVRMSAHKVGGEIPRFPRLPVTVSTVSKGEPTEGAHICPAPKQENNCGSCRACWDRSVPVVGYHLH
jgi:hypothetical protein